MSVKPREWVHSTGRLWQFVRFVHVGLLTNLVYFGVLALLHFLWGGQLWLNAALAYLLSAVVNYVLHYQFTFKSSSSHDIAIMKYVVVQSIGLTMNSMILHLVVAKAGVHYVLGQAVAIIFVTGFTFLINRNWVFSTEPRHPRG